MWESYSDDDEDTTVLHTVTSICRCAMCQQRSRGMRTHRSSTIVTLPSDDAGWSSYWQICVDRDSFYYLNQKRVINWCSGTYKLYPIKTTGSVVVFV